MSDSLLETIGEKIQGFYEKIQETYDALTSDLGTNRKKQAIVVGIGVLIVLLAFLILNQATVPLTLHVTDSNGQPLDGATVRLFDSAGNFVGSGKTVNGTVTFQVQPGKSYSFTVSANGYDNAKGTYDPAHPDSANIKMSPKSPDQLSDNATMQGPLPPIPAQTVITPGSDTTTNSFADVQTADAQLTVTVRDSATHNAIPDASVSLYDGDTQAFLVQGNTDSQGVLSAGVRQNTKVTIKAVADKYAPSEPLTVSIGGATAAADIALDSETSRNAVSTLINVTYRNDTPAVGAEVQVFSNLPVVQQTVPDNGAVGVLLSRGNSYTVRASQAGFLDAVSSLSAGDSKWMVLDPIPASVSISTLTVTALESNGQPSSNSLIGLFEKINGAFIPIQSSTANALGVSTFNNLQTGWDVQINATSAYGTGSQSAEIAISYASNSIQLTFAPQSKNQNSATATPSPSATATLTASTTPSPTPTGTVSATPSVIPSAEPTETTIQATVCLNPSNGPTHADANGFTYTLVSLNGANAAAFQVTKGPAMICPAYTPDCAYALGAPTSVNLALAKITAVDVQLISVELKKSCVTLDLSTVCTGNTCSTESCPTTSDPVCGSDGTSYLNSCHAKANKVTAYVSGVCSVQCTSQYDPVCAQNGIQYDNACLARQDGQTYQSGVCSLPTNTVFTYVPAGFSAISPMGAGALLATNCTTAHRYVFQSYDSGSQTFSAVAPSANAQKNMQYESGYVVYSDKDCRLDWAIQSAAEPYQHPLVTGWNLIGGPQKSLTTSQITGTCSNVQYRPEWGATDPNAATRGQNILGSGDSLQPGHGYWAYSNANCNLREECKATYTCQRNIHSTVMGSCSPTWLNPGFLSASCPTGYSAQNDQTYICPYGGGCSKGIVAGGVITTCHTTTCNSVCPSGYSVSVNPCYIKTFDNPGDGVNQPVNDQSNPPTICMSDNGGQYVVPGSSGTPTCTKDDTSTYTQSTPCNAGDSQLSVTYDPNGCDQWLPDKVLPTASPTPTQTPGCIPSQQTQNFDALNKIEDTGWTIVKAPQTDVTLSSTTGSAGKVMQMTDMNPDKGWNARATVTIPIQPTSSGSVSFDFKADRTNGFFATVLASATGAFVYTYFNYNGRIQYWHDPGSYVDFPIAKTYNANQWYHVEIRWYGSTFDFFVDGQKLTTSPLGYSYPNNAGPVTALAFTTGQADEALDVGTYWINNVQTPACRTSAPTPSSTPMPSANSLGQCFPAPESDISGIVNNNMQAIALVKVNPNVDAITAAGQIGAVCSQGKLLDSNGKPIVYYSPPCYGIMAYNMATDATLKQLKQQYTVIILNTPAQFACA